MIFRLLTGVGFLVLACVIVFIGGIGRSFGGLALVLVLLVLGVALIVTAYFQPNLSGKITRLVTQHYPPNVRKRNPCKQRWKKKST
jgi:hypothetical protein